ncbi:MAG: hypothetical protein PHX08_01255 [Lachnospiraceae bacterium]|nr:hypothetical protein [Lachnospiraceae bacterium]
MNSLFETLKNILRRRFRYHSRMVGNSILMSKKHAYDNIDYSSIVDMIGKKIDNYVCEEQILTEKKNLLKNYYQVSFNGDWMGKVLRKEGKIYRGIYKESYEKFVRLWDTGIIQVLGQEKMIPKTEISKYYTEEYPIILEHEVVEISTSKSWCPEMIRDACIFMCVLRSVLQQKGYTLHDGHLNNVSYYRGFPIFTDIGSIVEDIGQWDGFSHELVYAGLYRLIFTDLNNSILKRIQVFDEYNNAIWLSDRIYDDMTFEYYKSLQIFKRNLFLHANFKLLWKTFKIFDLYYVTPKDIAMLFNYKIEGIKGNKCRIEKECINKIEGLIDSVINDICSVTDIDSTDGELIASIKNKYNVACCLIETDDMVASNIYRKIKEKKLNINTIMLNIMYGMDDITLNVVQADLVVSWDILNSINCYQAWRFDSVMNALFKITKRYALFSIVNRKSEDQRGRSELAKTVGIFFIIKKNLIIELKEKKYIIYLVEKKNLIFE